MKVLVASGSTQGSRASDVDDCADGELLWLPDPCGAVEPDGSPCPCSLRFVGVPSEGWTTTAVVRDLPELGRRELLAELRAGVCRDCCPPARLPWAVERLLRIAGAFPEGTLVERTLDGAVRARFCDEHQHAWAEPAEPEEDEDEDEAEEAAAEAWLDAEPR